MILPFNSLTWCQVLDGVLTRMYVNDCECSSTAVPITIHKKLIRGASGFIIKMFLSLKKAYPLRLMLNEQLIRGTSKIAVKVDVDVQKQIEAGVNPRRHPGIIKCNRVELPERIQKSLQKIVGDYPITTLMEDCKKLSQFIASRHPPAEVKELNAKFYNIMEEIDTLMPQEEYSKLDEEGQKKWQRRKEQLIKRRLKERTFSWKPIKYGKYESIVYALGRGPLEFAVLTRIIEEIKVRDPDFKPQSYLDFGSGIGTGMWAVSNQWKNSIYEYYNIDSSRDMNELSELILKDGNENQQMALRNVFYRQFLPGLEVYFCKIDQS